MIPVSAPAPAIEPPSSALHYRVVGQPGALPDVVLDHGGGGSADDWNHLVPLLAAHTRVFSYDRAGMGDSPADGQGCSAPAVSQRLARLVEQMGVRKPFILAGYSLGGLYARHYAQLHPQDVAGLVLVDATPTALEIPKAKVTQALRLLTALHWVARSGLATLYGYFHRHDARAEKFRRMVARIAAPDYMPRMREELEAISGVQAEVARIAPRLQHPTLAVLAGTAPKQMSAEEFARTRELHEQLAADAPAPLSHRVVVHAATHSTLMGNAEHAPELAGHILAFARSLSTQR